MLSAISLFIFMRWQKKTVNSFFELNTQLCTKVRFKPDYATYNTAFENFSHKSMHAEYTDIRKKIITQGHPV